jgi:hypothetical protein
MRIGQKMSRQTILAIYDKYSYYYGFVIECQVKRLKLILNIKSLFKAIIGFELKSRERINEKTFWKFLNVFLSLEEETKFFSLNQVFLSKILSYEQKIWSNLKITNGYLVSLNYLIISVSVLNTDNKDKIKFIAVT